jgi:hypothetical protein
MHDYDPFDVELVDGLDERTDHVRCDPGSRIAQDMGFADIESEDGQWIDAGVHACDDHQAGPGQRTQ